MQFADEVRTYTCIRCPLGCRLEVSFDSSGDISELGGYSCARGKEYAREESSDPRRMVTSLVYVRGCLEPLSVKTSKAVPKILVGEVLSAIQSLRVQTPIKAGGVLIEGVCGTDSDVVATKSLDCV